MIPDIFDKLYAPTFRFGPSQLLANENVGVFHFDAHLIVVGDEVERDVAAVEVVHTFDYFRLGLERSGMQTTD